LSDISDNSQQAKSSSEKISFNSRSVLIGLFALVMFILLVFAAAVNWYPSNDVGRLNTVFIAAISGSLALGGTLISQLWGKSGEANLPVVYNKDPFDSQTEVPVNKQVSALFNKTMNGDTINTKTFTLKDKPSGPEIDSTVTLEGGNAILKPSQPLSPATKYTATIFRIVMDIEGNSMAGDVTWSFTTESNK
jgi:hypothetical protein